MAELAVEIVSEEKSIWQGSASAISARTIHGEIGILPGHTPMLAVLGDGEVVVRTDGGTVTAQAHGGFFSVDHDRVVIAASTASLGGAAA